VVLRITVLASGKVENPRVRTSLDVGLDLNAIDAVRKWKFVPATLDGDPVTTDADVEVGFSRSGASVPPARDR
jgi:TonB family protein